MLGDAGVCLNDAYDSQNCGSCGNDCNSSYALGAQCSFLLGECYCPASSVPCVMSGSGPLNPTCACAYDCSQPSVTFEADIFPLLSSTTVTVEPTWPSGGVLVGCAVSGCHDSTAAAGLDFTDPDASYQALAGGKTSVETCSDTADSIINPSQICACQSLVVPFNGGISLLYELLVNSVDDGLPLSSACGVPVGGTVNPMPIDDGGNWHPLSTCLAAEVRQWIDQGAVY
jgi:hypothetical protein